MPATQELRSRSSKKASKKAEANQSVPSSSAKATRDLLTEAGTFTFSLSSAFRILFTVRCISALFGVIQDCDEVFNYWEPMHYLQYGYGLQTWEYSPEFGIRSWAYILINAIGAWISNIMATNKLQIFYLLRIAFAAISSFVEARFYRTVTEEINPHVGRYVFVALFFSAGMFNAATALLPSTFAMWTTFMAYSYILRPPMHMNDKRTNFGVFWLGLGALLGWPFSGAIGIPFVIEELLVYGRETVMNAQGHAVQFVRPANWRVQRLVRLVKAATISGAVISIPIVLIDWFFYRRLLFVPLNIVLYNVFGGEGQGPDIFGIEPWYYYIVNGFLNFNILFLFALGSAPLVLIASYVDRDRVPGSSKWDAAWPYILLGLKLIPFYIWFGIFTLQPHKEERFLYVAYPFIALNAAISIFLIRGWTSRVARALGASVLVRASIIRYTSFAILAVFGVVSVSRIVAVTTRYRAPIRIYGRLWQERPPDQIVNLNYLQENYPYDASLPEINVCVGKEWFRYPGSYFLPRDARLQFIKSNFDGMLPKPFTPEDIATKTYQENGQEYTYRTRQLKFEGAHNAQAGFNSYNKADPLGYVDISKCDYLVDADYPLRPQSPHEPDYIKDTKNWEIIACEPFLDAENSNRLSRAFFVPGSKGLAWGDYCLLKKRS